MFTKYHYKAQRKSLPNTVQCLSICVVHFSYMEVISPYKERYEIVFSRLSRCVYLFSYDDDHEHELNGQHHGPAYLDVLVLGYGNSPPCISNEHDDLL